MYKSFHIIEQIPLTLTKTIQGMNESIGNHVRRFNTEALMVNDYVEYPTLHVMFNRLHCVPPCKGAFDCCTPFIVSKRDIFNLLKDKNILPKLSTIYVGFKKDKTGCTL